MFLRNVANCFASRNGVTSQKKRLPSSVYLCENPRSCVYSRNWK